jgi:hypothetical protein
MKGGLMPDKIKGGVIMNKIKIPVMVMADIVSDITDVINPNVPDVYTRLKMIPLISRALYKHLEVIPDENYPKES